MTLSLLEIAPVASPCQAVNVNTLIRTTTHDSRHFATVEHRRAVGTNASSVDEERVTAEAAHGTRTFGKVKQQTGGRGLRVGRKTHSAAR